MSKMRNYYIGKQKRANFLSGFSVVAWLILITVVISVIVFIATALTSDAEQISFFALNSSPLLDYFTLKPLNILSGMFLWTLILHIFVHGGIFHLLINMFVLFSLGGFTERIIGKKRFLWFYLISGVFAGLLSVVLAGFFGYSKVGEVVFGSPLIFMAGASGAIFGIAGLLMVLLPRLKFTIIFFPFFSLPAYVMIPAVLFVVWFVTIFVGLRTEIVIPVGNVAHFGGFLAGLIYGWYLRRKYRRKVQMLGRMFK